MKDLKKHCIEQYVQKKLTVTKEKAEYLINRIDEVSRIQSVSKYQELESEGRAEDGRAWLSIDAMAHGFYYHEKAQCNWGNLIWKKYELMLFPASLINGEYRVNYIQMLEPGMVVSISYPDLMVLRNEFIEISQLIEQISMKNERAYLQRIMLLNDHSVEKVIKFEADNPVFTAITSNSIKAMHLGLSRQGYNLLHKKIKEQA